MPPLRYLIFLLFTAYANFFFAQQWELAAPVPNETVIHHRAFSLSYSEEHEQASWVAYELVRDETIKRAERSDKFLIDPLVPGGSATHADYKGSGFDRGHLAPAADMSFSTHTMQESFYYSNMSPQYAGFNRGIWKRLEALVRNWAVEYDTVYVVTGGILSDNLQAIGPNRVSVPRYFYKAVFRFEQTQPVGIAFLLRNEASKAPLQSFVLTIDSLEAVSGIDFFYQLPDKSEDFMESSMSVNAWTWSTSSNTGSESGVGVTAAQCKGITQSGHRCKNRTTNESGYCYIHSSQDPANTAVKKARRSVSVRCSATTKAGTRCKRKTYSPNGKCFQHGGD